LDAQLKAQLLKKKPKLGGNQRKPTLSVRLLANQPKVSSQEIRTQGQCSKG